MDKLDKIFEMQKNLDEYIKEKRHLNFSKEEWLTKKSLALIDEIGELLNELNYKWWKNPKELSEENIKEEIIDIVHFTLSLCLDAGIDSNELFEIYNKKNQENINRQNGLSKKDGYKII